MTRSLPTLPMRSNGTTLTPNCASMQSLYRQQRAGKSSADAAMPESPPRPAGGPWPPSAGADESTFSRKATGS
eukprot:7751918-Prorocentrum_lima.AAC.1